MFGAPEYEVDVEEGVVTAVRVLRGASCAATWDAGKKLIGTPVEDAARKMGIEAQFFCFADPAGWDPIYAKSPVHFAGKIHSKAIEAALEKVLQKEPED